MDKKIELMIVGAQKAGTTSLNSYLSQHPDIYTHFTIEFGLFKDLKTWNKGFDYFYKNTVTDTVKLNQNNSVFVAKRVGLMYDPPMMVKLKEHNPNIKITVVLRNPIERAFSAFWYCRNRGEPYSQFEDAIFINDRTRFKGDKKLEENSDYIGRSSYVQHLKNIYSIFPHENIKLFLFEEMIIDLNKYLNEICKFIDLEPHEFDTSIKYNERAESRSQLLVRILAPGKNAIINNLLPVNLRIKLKQRLKRANLKKEGSTQKTYMKDDTRLHLNNIFKQDMPELEQLTKLPLKKYWQEFFT